MEVSVDDDDGTEDMDENIDEDKGETGVLNVRSLDHVCTRNYDGNSGAMEYDGLLLLMKNLHISGLCRN